MSNHGYQIPIDIPDLKVFRASDDLLLENGGILKNWCLGYHTFGKLNENGSNVLWVCHALTANSDLRQWWGGLIGPGKSFDTDKYYVICVNMLGSCYGSSCPRSIDSDTSKAYGQSFPLITFRDMADAYVYLAEYLGIRSIHLAIGGSCGGHQILEMALSPNFTLSQLLLLVCGPKESPWLIAKHEAQRLALEIDRSLWDDHEDAGKEGLMAARAMAMGGYRTFENFNSSQTDEDGRLNDFSASSYIRYQGEKLTRRFLAQSYWHLSKSLDTHDIGRNRGGTIKALKSIRSPSLIISMNSDGLIPPSEQSFMAEHISQSELVTIESYYGHDGFLVEIEAISMAIAMSSIIDL